MHTSFERDSPIPVAVFLLALAVFSVGALSVGVAGAASPNADFTSSSLTVAEGETPLEGQLDTADVGSQAFTDPDIDDAEGVNITEPDFQFTYTGEPEFDYQLELPGDVVIEPEIGLDDRLLDLDYVVDDFTPAIDPIDIDHAIAEQINLDDDLFVEEELLIDDDFIVDEELHITEDLLADDQLDFADELLAEDLHIDQEFIFDDEIFVDEDVLLDDDLLVDDTINLDEELIIDFEEIDFDPIFDDSYNLTAYDASSDSFSSGGVDGHSAETDLDGETVTANQVDGIEDMDLTVNLSALDLAVEYDTLRTHDILEPELEAPIEEAMVMVQFDAGVSRSDIDAVEPLGYDLSEDLSETTHLATVPRANLADLADLSAVRSVTRMEPEMKIASTLDTSQSTTEGVLIETVAPIDTADLDLEKLDTNASQKDRTPDADELAVMGIDQERYEFRSSGERHLYIGELTGKTIDTLAANERVKWIDEWVPPEAHMADGHRVSGVETVDTLPAANHWDGDDVMVGVLDSGIDYDHPHFDDTEVVLSTDWTWVRSLPIQSAPDDDNVGHGTMVAGTITGESPDGEHRGVAPEASLTVSRVLEDPDYIPDAGIIGWVSDTSDVWVGAYLSPSTVFDHVAESAEAHGSHLDITTNSWGYDWGSYDYFMTRSTDKWANENPYTLMTTSNGNAADTSTWPAAGKNVVAVGAINDDHTLSWLNDIESPEDHHVKPDLNAPTNMESPDVGGGYDTGSGTSQSTPYVSGIAARYISHQKATQGVDRVRANEVKTALIASTTGQLNPAEYEGVGWGAINDQKLYELATTPNNQITSTIEDNTVNSHEIEVPADADHLEVTLSWSEKANKPLTSFLRNDLHLYLTDEDPDDVVDIDEGSWISSDDVTIDVNSPMQADADEDRTVRRVGIPTEDLEEGTYNILVHADDTTWDSDYVLYDIAVDMQGEQEFSATAEAFHAPADDQGTARVNLDAGHSGSASHGMLPAIAANVQLEYVNVENGDFCGWELYQDDKKLADSDLQSGLIGTVTGDDPETYVDFCVEPSGATGAPVKVDYRFSYVTYPQDRVTHPGTGTTDQGERNTIDRSVEGSVIDGALTDVYSTTHDPYDWSNRSSFTVSWDAVDGADGYSVLMTLSTEDSVGDLDPSIPGILEFDDDSAGTVSMGGMSPGANYIHVQTKDESGDRSSVITRGPYLYDPDPPAAVAGLGDLNSSLPADSVPVNPDVLRDSSDIRLNDEQPEYIEWEYDDRSLLVPHVVEGDSVTVAWDESGTDFGVSGGPSQYEYALRNHGSTVPLLEGTTGVLDPFAIPRSHEMSTLDVDDLQNTRSITFDTLDPGVHVFHVVPTDRAENRGEHDFHIFCVTGGEGIHECTEDIDIDFDLFGARDIELDIPEHQFDPLTEDLEVLTDDLDISVAYADCVDASFRDICDLHENALFGQLHDEDVGIFVDGEPRMYLEFEGDAIEEYRVVDFLTGSQVSTELHLDSETMTDVVYAEDRAARLEEAFLDEEIEFGTGGGTILDWGNELDIQTEPGHDVEIDF